MDRAIEVGTVIEPPVRISRTVHARPETVFRAWTSAEHLARWFAPRPYTIPEAKVQARVGGPFELLFRSPEGAEHRIRGTFAEVHPDRRLVIDTVVESGEGQALFRAYMEVDFAEALGGTRLDIVQTYTVLDPRVAGMIEGAPRGWSMTLDQLEEEVVAMVGGSETGERSAAHATFHLTRTYPVAAAKVWKALTDADAKAKWFGGSADKWEMLERRMDVRVGGTERVKGRWEGGVVSTFDAAYLDVIPNQRLVYSYVMHLNDKKISVSLATMELRAEGDRTTLAVTEQGVFLDGYDDNGSREHGTNFLLDALGASLTD